MTAYYNENDPYAAAWLRNLMSENLILPGIVDDRSIADVKPGDLEGFTQCHFFAGIGGWSLALRLAGWPDDRPVWTGSCPCQPFSVAGKQLGFEDPRHLWPVWQRLIAERRPSVVFGEQIARAPAWLDLVRSDLETMGYAVGAVPMEAASAGADHFRDRYWFVADHAVRRRSGQQHSIPASGEAQGAPRGHDGASCDRSLADSERQQIPIGELGNSGPQFEAASGNHLRALVDGEGVGWGEGWTEHEFRSRGFTAAVADIEGCQYLECPDGKWRRLPPPRVRWLGARLPARVAKLRAIGNAIDWRPAAQFIAAYLD